MCSSDLEGEPEAGVPPPPPEGTAEGGTPPPGAEAPVLAKPPEPEAAVDTTPVPVPPTWMVLGIAAFVGAAWAFRSRPRPLPETLRAHPTPPLLPGGPGPGDTPCAFVAEDPPALAAAVLPALARQRRVILVSRTWSAFAPLAEGPVYRSASDDCEEVEVAARALAAIPGAPVAVLVVGEEALVEPGAVKPDPFKRLRDGLPAGVWLGVVVAKEAPAGFPCWTASGPPFVLRGS